MDGPVDIGGAGTGANTDSGEDEIDNEDDGAIGGGGGGGEMDDEMRIDGTEGADEIQAGGEKEGGYE